MGGSHSCLASPGTVLLQAVCSGNTTQAREVLQHHPASACFSTYLDRNSPLLVAAGRGHLRLVQAIMEAAVMAVGPSKAKQRCINHTNHKGQSALTLACMNGHAQCVESLICNGASPLALDVARHNTALHWAASCCRSDCVQRLLSSSTAFQMRSGQVVQISEIPCFDEDNVTLVKYVDRHNGWGLTALHLAVYKGSHSTVRALLRGGASLVSLTVAGAVSNNPVRLPTGSTALHLAAAAEDLPLVKLLLEVQVSQGVQDQRRVQNSAGERPIDSVRSTTNLLLLHLLDPSQPFNFGPLSHAGFMLLPDALNPVTLGTLNPEYDAAGPAGGVLNIVTGGRSGYSVDLLGGPRQGVRMRHTRVTRSDQPSHVTLGQLLQRLRLVLSLELVALQERLTAASAASTASTEGGSTDATLRGKEGAAQQSAGQQPKQCQQQQSHEQQHLGMLADDSSGNVCSSTVGSASVSSSADADSAARPDQVSRISSILNNPAADAAVDGSSTGSRSLLAGKQQLLLLQQQMHRHLVEQQLRRAHTAECQALQNRCRVVESLLDTIDDMLGALSVKASMAAVSAGSGAAAATGTVMSQQQQHHHHQPSRRRNSRGRVDGDEDSRGAAGAAATQQPPADTGSSVGQSPAVDEAAAEQLLSAFVTPGTLSSLAAVMKLLMNSSTLSSKQQRQQQAAAGGASVVERLNSNSNSASVHRVPQYGRQVPQFGQPWLPGSSSVSSGSSRSFHDPVAAAGWAEQEHALVLVKSILQSAHASLKASQQAMAAAATRAALRQRQQDQLQHMLRDERRLSAGLMSPVGRRLLLGSSDGSQAGRMHFGLSIRSSRSRDAQQRSSPRAGGSSSSLTWPSGVDGSAAAAAVAAAAVGASTGGGRRHRRQHQEHRRQRHGRQNGSSSGGISRRHRGMLLSLPMDGPLHEAFLPPGAAPPLSRQQQQQQYLQRLQQALSRDAAAAGVGPARPSAGDGSVQATAPGSTPVPAPAAGVSHAAAGAASSSSSDSDGGSGGDRSARSGHSRTASSVSSSSSSSSYDAGRRIGRDLPAADSTAAVSAAAARAGGGDGEVQQQSVTASSAPVYAACASGQVQLPGRSLDQQQPAPSVCSSAHHCPAHTGVGASSQPLDDLLGHSGVQGTGKGSSLSVVHSLGSSCGENGDATDGGDGDSLWSSLDSDTCAICMDSLAGLSVSSCSHCLCLQCAFQLCCKAKGLPLCPFCRQPIGGFVSKNVDAV